MGVPLLPLPADEKNYKIIFTSLTWEDKPHKRSGPLPPNPSYKKVACVWSDSMANNLSSIMLGELINKCTRVIFVFITWLWPWEWYMECNTDHAVLLTVQPLFYLMTYLGEKSDSLITTPSNSIKIRTWHHYTQQNTYKNMNALCFGSSSSSLPALIMTS